MKYVRHIKTDISGDGEKQQGWPVQMPTKREFLILLPFALFYAVSIVLGDWQRSVYYSNLQNVGRIVLWTVISYLVLALLCFVISNGKKLTEHIPLLGSMPPQQPRKGKWCTFLLFFLICLCSYLPFYLMYYPTWFNNDAIWQLEQILGWKARSNHHPYFHTMIIQFFYRIGYQLFGNNIDAVAFYTFWQMAVAAAVFAFYLYVLYRRGTRLLWIGAAIAFYVFVPIHGMLSICMGKDAFFVAVLLLFAWLCQICAPGREEKRLYIMYFAAGLLLCMLRSNGIFIFLGTAVVLLVSGIREKRFRFWQSACLLAVLLCYLLYQGPLLRAMQVEPPDTIEALSMPTQHIMCTYVKGGSLTEEEIALIDAVAPVENMEEHYNPYLFDIAKAYIREEGNQQVIKDNKWQYLKLWFRAGLRNPMLYLEAEVRQTAGYWAYRTPHEEYLYGEYYMVDNPFGITAERKFFSYDDSLAMGRMLMKFQQFYNRVWNMGRTTWLLVFALAYMAYQKRRAAFSVPFIMLLGSLLLATPVYNEFRYAYGLFAALPLLLSYAFGPSYPCGAGKTGEKEDKNEKMA